MRLEWWTVTVFFTFAADYGGFFGGAELHFFFWPRLFSSFLIPALATSASCSPLPPPTPTAPTTCPSMTTGTPPFSVVSFPPLAAAAFWRLRFNLMRTNTTFLSGGGCSRLGVTRHVPFHLPARDYHLSRSLILQVGKEYRAARPRVLYLPHRQESDHEHRLTHEVAVEAQ